MFRYDTLREQWAIMAIFVGIALVLYFIVYYLDLEKPRKRKPGGEYETNYLSAWDGIPWSLRITAVIIVISMILYLIQHIINPNSW